MIKPIKKEIIGTLPFGLILSNHIGVFYKEKENFYYMEVVPLPTFTDKRDDEIWKECLKEIKEEEKQNKYIPPPFITPYEEDSDFE